MEQPQKDPTETPTPETPPGNGILSEQAAAEERRARGTEPVTDGSDEKTAGAVKESPESWHDEQERRGSALRAAQTLPSSATDVASLLKNAAAIDAWLKTGETS